MKALAQAGDPIIMSVLESNTATEAGNTSRSDSGEHERTASQAFVVIARVRTLRSHAGNCSSVSQRR